VGDYIGAQMAGFDAAGQIGLIDHLQEGEIYVPYIERTVVVGGTPPIITTVTGDLPEGMAFDDVEGVLYGTPEASGVFSFTVHSIDAAGGDVTKNYDLVVEGEIVVDEAPVISLVSPTDGTVVSNTTTIEATAADDIAVTSVIFAVDDVVLWETAGPYITDWDTATVPDGWHTITAYAYDGAGNVGIALPVAVYVDNATPIIASEPPALTQEAGYAYRYTVLATGNPAPVFIKVLTPEGMTLARKSGFLRWIPTGAQLGTHSVTVRASNSAGADEQSWDITVVDTRRPTVPKDLVATEVTSSTVSLAWSPSTDRGGVVGYRLYEFYRNSSTDYGWRIAQDNLPGTSTTVTGLTANRIKKYRVTAYDHAGNESGRSTLLSVRTLR
jgi:hypothetical protein